MATRERLADRGSRLARESLERLGRDLRAARIDRGLSCAAVGIAVGRSAAEVSRVERARSARVPYVTLARMAAVVGLEISLRAYPGATPLRDAAHARLLADFRAGIHPSLHWASEVPLPIVGDQRAWDAMLIGRGWRFGVEAETAPADAQAFARRIGLKERDGHVDGVLLVVRETRRVRAFLAAATPVFGPAFPVPAREALTSLRAGTKPVGNAIIVVPYRRGGPPAVAPRDGAPAVAPRDGRPDVTPRDPSVSRREA